MKNWYKDFLIHARKRRALARRLAKKGLTYEEIGKRLGVTRQRVYEMIKTG
jgi:predicted transcriptional regulator